MSDADLDKAIANIAAQNKMSVDQLRSRLSYEGLNYNTYRSQIRKEMLISEVRNNEVRRRVTILPQEVDSLAKQVGAQNGSDTEMNISHILIRCRRTRLSSRSTKPKSWPNAWWVRSTAAPTSASWRSPTPPTLRR